MMIHSPRRLFPDILYVLLGIAVLAPPSLFADDAEPTSETLFADSNLVAWCIVPFDAKKRSPETRAEMVAKLGFTKVAYDWRAEHVSQFEREILAYRKHDLEFFAFWSWHPGFGPLIKKHGITPQIWLTNPSLQAKTQAERVRLASERLLPTVKIAIKHGCRVGLYNHGGWGGEPANLIAVARKLRADLDTEAVGIVYNLHHAHGTLDTFPESLRMMKPLLLCLNINGMNARPNPKILPLGSGAQDRDWLRTIRESGYDGPIGILDHRSELDAEQSLRQNLDGLRTLLKR